MSDEKPSPPKIEHLKPFQFKQGETGNASGRPKGLERRTRELLGDDIDGINYVQRCIAFGVSPDLAALDAMGVKLNDDQREQIKRTFSSIKVKDANEAAKDLKDRGWGKAKLTVKVNEKSGRSVPKQMPTMSRESLRALAVIDESFADVPDDELDDLDERGGPTQH